MKKSLLISAAAFAALSMSADGNKIVWDFNSHGIFAGQTAQINIIDQTGMNVKDKEILMDATKDTENFPDDPYCNQHGIPNRVVSLFDGRTYSITPDETLVSKNGTFDNPCKFTPGEEIEPGVFTEDEIIQLGAEYSANLKNNPFICWLEKAPENNYYGPARVIGYPSYGSSDAWTDANWNAGTEADWISDKGAITLIRGKQGKKPVGGTYIQFPEVQGPFKMVWYAGSTNAVTKFQVIPVVNGNIVENKIQSIDESDKTAKRYYKRVYNYDGADKVAIRIMVTDHTSELYLQRVEFETSGNSGIEDIIVNPVEDENAPVYNVLGQRVDENYKGIVIKNGKKYIQK